jgi:hypothetical protein
VTGIAGVPDGRRRVSAGLEYAIDPNENGQIDPCLFSISSFREFRILVLIANQVVSA